MCTPSKFKWIDMPFFMEKIAWKEKPLGGGLREKRKQTNFVEGVGSKSYEPFPWAKKEPQLCNELKKKKKQRR